MKRSLTLIMLGVYTMFLSACSSDTPENYRNETPVMDVREYFNGKVEARGVLQDWKGRVTKRFVVYMDCSWQGNVGTLKERFEYSDGRTDSREWTLTMQDDHHFTGTAGDVVGTAKGKQFGNAMQMVYVLDAKRDSGDTIRLSFDDWMYRLTEDTLLNISTMKKFGIPVGKLTLTFQKVS